MRHPGLRQPPASAVLMKRRPLMQSRRQEVGAAATSPLAKESRQPQSSDHHRRGGLTAKKKEKLRERAPGLSLCQTYRVAPATEVDYTETLREINRFAYSWPDFSWDFPQTADEMLVGLFDDKALDGVHAGWAGKAFSSIGYFFAEYSGAMRSLLPKAKAAQAGWNSGRIPLKAGPPARKDAGTRWSVKRSARRTANSSKPPWGCGMKSTAVG